LSHDKKISLFLLQQHDGEHEQQDHVDGADRAYAQVVCDMEQAVQNACARERVSPGIMI
jgi:hypothetical protein